MHELELTTGRALRGVIVEAALLVIVLMILRLRGWSVRRLGLWFSAKGLISGVLLFIAYILLYWTTAFIVASLYPSAATVRPFRFVVTSAPTAMIAFIVVNSFFEETIVSGYVINALSPQGPGLTITASTLLRFLYHLYQGPLVSISILPLGLLFGAVFWRWRNLWPLIVAHTIANLIAFLIVGR